jgi:hypothetical protein
LAAPVNSRIDVELEVWASPFSRIDSISIYRDNQSNLQRIRPPIEDPLRFPLESKQETKTITLDYLTVDVALHAVARGWRGAGGLFSEINGRNEASVPTYAISGPVFIDGDGDGKYTPPEGKARFGSY